MEGFTDLMEYFVAFSGNCPKEARGFWDNIGIWEGEW
jgi:hypothetical protein